MGDLRGAVLHGAATKTLFVVVAWMGTNLHIMLFSKGNGSDHHIGIAGMETAGYIRLIYPGHHILIHANFPASVAFSLIS